MLESSDAVYIPAKCGKNNRQFYMIYYKSYDNKWVLTYGKTEVPSSSSRGHQESAISVTLSPFRLGPQYKCPFCGQKHTFTCWNCGKRTCYDGDNHDGREVTCAHCGKSGIFSSKGGSSGRKTMESTSAYGITGQT